MYVIKKLRGVEAEVASAAEWYESQRAGLGQRFINSLQSADQLLLANPFRYSIRFGDVRRLNLAASIRRLFLFARSVHNRRDSRAILERRRRLV
jgi:hypothetical protein